MLHSRFIALVMSVGIGLSTFVVHAADEAPDALVSRLSTSVLASIKADKSLQAGGVQKIMVQR